MRLASLLAAAALLSASAGFAQPQPGAVRVFGAKDLFSLQVASDPQVRPDGGAIAYVRISNDIMTDSARQSIWLVDAATGSQTPLETGDAGFMAPRWSPEGSRLAYISTAPTGAQLYVRWMTTGRSAKVATLEQAPKGIVWSPDGKSLAFTMLVPEEGRSIGPGVARPEGAKWAEPLKVIERVTYRADGEGFLKPGYSQVFIVSADGGQPQQLTSGKFNAKGPISFTRDGASILYATNQAAAWEREPPESEIYAVTIEDGSITRLTTRVGPDGSAVASPDGSRIAYVGYDGARRRGYENQRLYIMDRDGRNSRVLTAGLDRSVGDPQWAADGKSLYFAYDEEGSRKVARVSLDGRVETLFSGLGGSGLDRPYTGGQFSVGRNGLVAFTDGTPERPSDLAIWRRGRIETLTALNGDLMAGKAMARVQRLPVASSFDGKPIGAWIATPPHFDPGKKYPLILEIHGGPFSAYGPTFATDVQLYAAAGYVVVYANPRGSTSYGEAFANEIDRNYPGHDYDDLMSVVDSAITLGFVDPGHLYVTGGSGGGALTAWIVGKTDRFRAAATQKPVINWSSQVLTTDNYTFMAAHWFGKMPWEDPQGYWARSPLSLVGNVKTPTLVMVGDRDDRTPPSEADQYYAALQLRGVPTSLIRVPFASHGGIAARPSQSGAKAQAILAWFERFK